MSRRRRRASRAGRLAEGTPDCNEKKGSRELQLAGHLGRLARSQVGLGTPMSGLRPSCAEPGEEELLNQAVRRDTRA